MSDELLKRIEELEAKLLDSNEQNKNLEIEKEKLENRFGLVWKNVPEKFIKALPNNEIVYGKSKYSFLADIKSGSGKKMKFEQNGIEKDIIRQADSYLFKDRDGIEYLSHSGKVYIFLEKTNEHYVPILEKKGESFQIGEANKNILIEGDNYFALQMLQYTHKGKVDVICIDPPYNTGNKDFKYNDAFINYEDGDKHSSWLSFMEKRLILSKKLLSKEGLIFVNIDEAEINNLTLLMNSVFGEANFIENFIWDKNSTKNNSKTTSTNHEYTICFAMNKKYIENLSYFRVKKEGFDEIIKLREAIINNSDIKDKKEYLEKEIKSFYKSRPELKGISQYKKVDKELNIFRLSDISAPGGKGALYSVTHPDTHLRCKESKRGWAFNENKMKKLIKENKIHFGKNESTVPQYKRFLKDVENEILKSVIKNTSEGKKELLDLFEKAPFNNPKPISLLKCFINCIPNKNLTVLDFFAGSGSTGHAVWDLNKEDGGNRKFILVTNNESNICEEVTFERLKRANEKYDYNESLEYLKIKHIEDREINKEDSQNDFKILKEVINLKFDCFKVVEETNDWYVTEELATLKNLDKINEFFEKFNEHKHYALVARQKRKFHQFLEVAKKHTNNENIYHMSKDYLNDIKKQISKEEE